jgi:hypothetical protein
MYGSLPKGHFTLNGELVSDVILLVRCYMESFKVNNNNPEECREVIKSVLWMYHDMITSYRGFGHNIDFEEIDYNKYFFTEPTDSMLNDIAMLMGHGSLIALCCEVVNLLDEGRRSQKVLDTINQLLSNHKIKNMPKEESLLSAMVLALKEQLPTGNQDWTSLTNGSMLNKKLHEAYQHYVLGYYRKML